MAPGFAKENLSCAILNAVHTIHDNNKKRNILHYDRHIVQFSHFVYSVSENKIQIKEIKSAFCGELAFVNRLQQWKKMAS